MRRHTLVGNLLSGLLLLSMILGCSAEPDVQTPPMDEPTAGSSDSTGDLTGDADSGGFVWADEELTNALTGETFTLREFAGTPVYVQAFAVW